MSRTRKSDHPYAIKALRRLDPNLLTFLAVLSAVPVRAHDPAKPASRAGDRDHRKFAQDHDVQVGVRSEPFDNPHLQPLRHFGNFRRHFPGLESP